MCQRDFLDLYLYPPAKYILANVFIRRNWRFTIEDYEGLKVMYNIITNRVVTIDVSRKGLQNTRGISIGDSEEDVITRYGQTKKWDGKYLFYEKYESYSDYEYALKFTILNNKVSNIMFFLQEINC